MQNLSADDVEAQIDLYERDATEFMAAVPNLGRPTQYWFISPYRQNSAVYPTKPLVAAALKWPDVNGGFSKPDSACNVLERAGYVITDASGEPILPDGTSKPISSAVAQATDAFGTTEALAMVRRRVGQNLFRLALLKKWKGRCAVTGISDVSLLRASHIQAWADCDADADRLNPSNGILLSALWDAAFDAGSVSFTDTGDVLVSADLSEDAKKSLGIAEVDGLWFDDDLAPWLAVHRAKHGFA